MKVATKPIFLNVSFHKSLMEWCTQMELNHQPSDP